MIISADSGKLVFWQEKDVTVWINLRELAIESFGKRAKAWLNSWGIFKREDFGEVVFNLVKVGLLAKQAEDTKEAFQGGYNFDVAFPS